MKAYKLLICLFLITIISVANAQNDSINYQDYPKDQLQTVELQQVARIFPQIMSYYYQNRINSEINAKQAEIIDTLLIALAKTDLREIKYLDQLKLKDEEIKLVRPKWWQQPEWIVAEVILALILGLMIAK